MRRIMSGLIVLAFLASLSGTLPSYPVQAATSAKYIILFQGDGMGAEHIRAGGMYTNGAAGSLVFESFPYRTTMTHNNASNATTDSAASATAMATGVKVNNGVISVRLPGDGSALSSLLELHKLQGRSVGLVTESYLTDASPAAHGAHDTSRNNYAAIFADYVTQSQPNVLFGGGGNGFDATAAAAQGYTVVTDRAALLGLSTETQTRIVGGFGNGLIPPDGTPGRSTTLPTLPELTQQALAILDNDPDGFYVFIEHEGIDEYSHSNSTEGMVRSVREFNAAVQQAVNWVNVPTNDADWSNTLIVIVGDHETGGLTVTETNPQTGVVPAATWSTTGHTQTPVAVFAQGAGANQITGSQIDNTAIFSILSPSGSGSCTSVTLTTGADTWMDAAAPTATHGSDTKLAVDGSPDNSILIRWDVNAVPANSLVTGASITFTLPDANDQSASVFEFYTSRRAWSEANASWTYYDAQAAWGMAGAQSTDTDRGTVVLATSPTGGTPPTQLVSSLNVDGVAQLQRWVNGVEPNYGFAVQDYADTSSDGFRFSSFNSATPPQLLVSYCPPVVTTPTNTSTPTPTDTSTPTPTDTSTPTPTDTPTPTPTDTSTATPTDTPTAPPTDTPTATPTTPPSPTPTATPQLAAVLYVSSDSGGTASGVSFADEDILVFDIRTGGWSMAFDGSDVGLGSTDVDAFDFQPDGSILLSFDSSLTLTGLGSVDDSDIVRFAPVSLGSSTAGSFSWYFDGSDVGLTDNNEDIDAMAFAPDGKLVISTIGAFSVTGVSGDDEDLLSFTATQLGATTNGSWSLYFDGSDVGLSETAPEDVYGAWIDPITNQIYLTTVGTFSVPGASGDGADIFVCTPGALGVTTICSYSMVWDGSANGFAGEVVDALDVTR